VASGAPIYTHVQEWVTNAACTPSSSDLGLRPQTVDRSLVLALADLVVSHRRCETDCGVGDLEAELVVEFRVLVEFISPLLVLKCELVELLGHLDLGEVDLPPQDTPNTTEPSAEL